MCICLCVCGFIAYLGIEFVYCHDVVYVSKFGTVFFNVDIKFERKKNGAYIKMNSASSKGKSTEFAHII